MDVPPRVYAVLRLNGSDLIQNQSDASGMSLGRPPFWGHFLGLSSGPIPPGPVFHLF
jgi:hypothetical protein